MSSQAATAGPLARLAEVPGPTLVRWALGIDAAVTGFNGLAYVALAGVLDSPLGISEGALRGLGAFLAVFALGVGYLASRPQPSRTAVGLVADANAAWALASIGALVFGWADPELLGGIWIALQALVVAGFAAAQVAAQRRADRC